MKKIKNTIIAVVCLLLFASACGRVSIDLGAPDAPAQEADETGGTITVAESAPDRAGDLIPDGVLISTGSEDSLTFVDHSGAFVREIEAPGMITIDPEDVFIAGPILPDGPFPPVVFHSWTPDQSLMVNTDGQITNVRESSTFLALIGAPGQDAFAFSEVNLNEDNYPHGFLYAATSANLSSAGPFYDLVDEPSYWALKPVGVQTVAGQAQGVWYVKTAWGIGGVDLIFPINRGLLFFDLTSGDNQQVLDEGHNLQGISPGLTFAASVDAGNDENTALSVTDLASGQAIQFMLDPATDRGAGWAVFSPDDRYVAWLEATGSMISDPYDFHPRVRVGDVSTGGVVQSVEDTAVNQVIGGGSLTMLHLAGWLDNETLLIEVRGADWDDVSLLRFDIQSGSLAPFSDGSFLAFGYQ